MPVDQFVKDLARLEEFILVRAVHQLDAAKQQGVALERRQRLGQDMLDLGVEYGEMHRLGDMIRKFAFRPQEIADSPFNRSVQTTWLVRASESSALTMIWPAFATYAPLRT